MDHILKPPPAALSHIVKGFWAFELKQEEKKKIQISSFVNDSTGLTFFLEMNTPVYRAVIEGHNTKPQQYSMISSILAFGVQFHHGVLPRLFGYPASDFTNREVLLDDVISANISERMVSTESMAQRISIVGNALGKLATKIKDEDKLVIDCLEKIYANHFCRVSDILKAYRISERELERRFAVSLGVSPRHFLKVARFKRVLSSLRAQSKVKMIDLALELDYFDQAHFVNDVKQLSGYTPTALRKKLLQLPVNQKGSTGYLVNIAPESATSPESLP